MTTPDASVPEATLLTCPGCGAGLDLAELRAGAGGTAECHYCGGAIVLPGQVSNRFQPAHTGLCPSCGNESGGGMFCAHCGTALAAAPASTKKFCATCGTLLGGGKFCPDCGAAA
jgi:primosomal protein N'